MTWKGRHPLVKLVTQTYPTGVKLTQLAMTELETQLQRLTCLERNGGQLDLGKWFVDILSPQEPHSE